MCLHAGSLLPVHIDGSVARNHAANMRAEGTGVSVRIHLAKVEIIVTLIIRTEAGIVVLRRENERRSAPPSSHQFGRQQLLAFRSCGILAEKLSKDAHMLFHPKVGNITAIAREDLGLRKPRARPSSSG